MIDTFLLVIVYIGRKYCFSGAVAVYQVAVEYLNSNAGILRHGSGLQFARQALALAAVIALSSPTNSPTAPLQNQLTFSLTSQLCSHFNDETIRLELLNEVWLLISTKYFYLCQTLSVSCLAVQCYWQPGSDTQPPGESVRPTVEFLIQVCISSQHCCFLSNIPQLLVACLDANVSPHDALLAMEGVLKIHNQKSLFQLSWFQTNCWCRVANACIKAIMYRIHVAHHDTVAALLTSLCEGVADSSQCSQLIAQETIQVASSADIRAEAEENLRKAVNSSTGGEMTIQRIISHVLHPLGALLNKRNMDI